MGDNSFHAENDRLESFYERAEEISRDKEFTIDYHKQAVEALSKIADDKGFPLQEMSDKEILSIGVFLHNVGELFFRDGEPLKKLSEEIAEMDDSALKSFYKGILSTEKDLGIDYDYDVIKDKEKRKHIAEFIYQIVEKDNYFIIKKVSPGAFSLSENETKIPVSYKLIEPCPEGKVRDTLLDYINRVSFSPLKKEGAQYNNAGLPKSGAFKYLYNKL